MIREYTAGLAAQMEIKLSRVSIIDGKLLGCRDSHLLQIYSDNHMESVLIYQSELETLQNEIQSDRLETRIRGALTRLKKFLTP